MTRYELYVSNWQGCTRCKYHERRKHVVTGKATSLPCDVLFVGESPGQSEDCHGVPFYGQAGDTMDKIEKASVPPHLTVGYNNLIGCFPLDEERQKEDPDDECVIACIPRLIEWIALCNPKLIVCVGKHAEDWLDQKMKVSIPVPKHVPIVAIKHPAAIAREPWVQRGLSVDQCVITIKTAIKKHITQKEKVS